MRNFGAGRFQTFQRRNAGIGEAKGIQTFRLNQAGSRAFIERLLHVASAVAPAPGQAMKPTPSAERDAMARLSTVKVDTPCWRSQTKASATELSKMGASGLRHQKLSCSA